MSIFDIRKELDKVEKELQDAYTKINRLEHDLLEYEQLGKAYYIQECKKVMHDQLDDIYSIYTVALSMQREMAISPMAVDEVEKHNRYIDERQDMLDSLVLKMGHIIDGTYEEYLSEQLQETEKKFSNKGD